MTLVPLTGTSTGIGSRSRQLRYSGGRAAAGLTAWRASLSAEQTVGIGALDDEAWCEFMTTQLGLNVRMHLK